MPDLHTADFDYYLPPDRIAQTPVEPRDSSRLLVIHRDTGALEHCVFRDLVDYLRPGDLLIANDSRVLPGRLWGRKPTGGRVELLLLRDLEDGWWEAFARPANRLRSGLRLTLEPPTDDPSAGSVVEIGPRTASGAVRVRFDEPVMDVVARYGAVPLPPYIHTPLADPERYQTVYSRVTGSAAAPTAGLHFTPRLLDQLAAMDVRCAFVTLHVGPDTFRPVKVERILDHEMHSEFVSVPDDTAAAIHAAKRAGHRVVAVGTTAVRALESWAGAVVPDQLPAGGGQSHVGLRSQDGATAQRANWPLTTDHRPLGWSGWTRLFIYPGYQFRVVDSLITNFHLPRSTLLMLISAFAGQDLVRRAYHEAVAQDYRFYSFGDACLFV